MIDPLRLELPAIPASVPLARREIAAHVEGLGMSYSEVADVKTIVTEAWGNAVRYAYGEAETAGTLEMTATRDGAELEIEICDTGFGFRPHPDADGKGLGLVLIGGLSNSFNLQSDAGKGTCLKVRVSLPDLH